MGQKIPTENDGINQVSSHTPQITVKTGPVGQLSWKAGGRETQISRTERAENYIQLIIANPPDNKEIKDTAARPADAWVLSVGNQIPLRKVFEMRSPNAACAAQKNQPNPRKKECS